MDLLENASEWIKRSHLAPSTLVRYACSIGQLARSGIASIGDLDPVRVERYLAERQRDGVSVTTCNRDLTAICSLARWLVRLGKLPRPVLAALRDLYEEEPAPPPIDWLRQAEFLALREVARPIGDALDLAVALAVGGGFRLGELRRLRHEELLLEEELPFARVLRTYGRRIKRDRQRTTPLPRALADELLSRGIGRGEGWVFESERLPFVAPRTMQVWLRDAADALGRRVTWVLLRHTFASWHVQAGVSIAKVARWMGNSVNVCERHYAGLAPGGDGDVERAFASIPPRPRSDSCFCRTADGRRGAPGKAAEAAGRRAPLFSRARLGSCARAW